MGVDKCVSNRSALVLYQSRSKRFHTQVREHAMLRKLQTTRAFWNICNIVLFYCIEYRKGKGRHSKSYEGAE